MICISNPFVWKKKLINFNEIRMLEIHKASSFPAKSILRGKAVDRHSRLFANSQGKHWYREIIVNFVRGHGANWYNGLIDDCSLDKFKAWIILSFECKSATVESMTIITSIFSTDLFLPLNFQPRAAIDIFLYITVSKTCILYEFISIKIKFKINKINNIRFKISGMQFWRYS